MDIVTFPERVQTYLKQKNSKRLPFSCTLGVLKGGSQVSELMEFATHSLKAGAGVKIIIDETFRLGSAYEDLSLAIVLDKNHPDWTYLVPDSNIWVHKLEDADYTITVKDNIESIASSFRAVENAVNNGYRFIQVDLSELRPRDSVNSDGLLASGPSYFLEIFLALGYYLQHKTVHSLLRLFGTLNEIILRGGYKKGIITSAIHSASPYLEEYLDVPLVSLRGSHKKGVILHQEWLGDEIMQKILDKVNTESMFLQKENQDPGLYSNVCMGILLRDRGTCLIGRVNLAQVTSLSQIVPAYREATTKTLTIMHSWRSKSPKASIWASIEDDLQVAIDPMGLANLLSRFGYSYKFFVEEMSNPDSTDILVVELRRAYKESTMVADAFCSAKGLPPLERLHSVEPAQTHSYRTTDADGFTTCRGIWTPFSRIVNRMSNTEEIATYDHGPVETRITPELHFEVCNQWQLMMDTYGRPHTISFDTWENFNPKVYKKWYNSYLPTLYYNFSDTYNDEYARKRVKRVSLCSVCEE